jgi:5'-methylthioadenosine phosphorylase
MTHTRFGFIGGSGLYALEGLEDAREVRVETPYGAPSDAIMVGRIDGVEVAFLTRHGRGHARLPGEVPYRANIWALKSLGVAYLVSISAVGSLKEELAPLSMVLPDQYVDLTKRRDATFFGDGALAHIAFADPICAALSDVVARAHAACRLPDAPLHRGGTYVCIEGPAFSTRAESNLYRSWGASIIGMTNLPEARLAREAEIAYATLAMVTDYDCWRDAGESVTAELAFANLAKNAANAQTLVHAIARELGREAPPSPAHDALSRALVTPPQAIGEGARARLAPLLARFYRPSER